MDKKKNISAAKNVTLKLKVKKLVVTAKEKESIRRKLATTAKTLKEFYKKLEGANFALKEKTKDLENTKIAVLNVLEDIWTEEKIIKQSEEKYRNLVGVMEEGLGVQDKNGTITFMNRRGCEMLGYTLEELLGKPTEMVFDEENRKILHEQMQKRKKGEHKSYEIAWLRKDGSKIDTITSPSPRFDEDGNFVESVAVFTDMTKEKEMDRAKSEFVSLASHQLSTPLTGIEWTIELFLKKEKLTKEGTEYLNDIYLSAKRLSVLIKLLLNVSRIESGSVVIQPEPLDLVLLINGYIREYQALFDKGKISCVFTKHPEKLVAVTDKNLFGYIIQNLISNSVSYTPANGKVEISLEEKKDSVFVTVRDTGIGIPKGEQARIFAKFMRASNAVISKPDGTGLGLYIVRESANLLGGKIWFESTEGKGTAFFIELPLTTKPRAGEKGLVLQRE
ncbi:MAG: PAS domain-containing sensor histidine kinase [bacterium]|nr:PAS domain-containing sensor histidine kinase [bacterium]